MKITDPEKAQEYFAALVERNVRITGVSEEEAIRIEKSNLGYWAGYYDYETMARVNTLFRTAHPIFGGTPPTAEEAFKKGMEIGKKEKDA